LLAARQATRYIVANPMPHYSIGKNAVIRPRIEVLLERPRMLWRFRYAIVPPEHHADNILEYPIATAVFVIRTDAGKTQTDNSRPGLAGTSGNISLSGPRF
jgi:hypothetical protein